VKDAVSNVRIRVRYAETDQMGVAHHANYLIWCEEARTDHMRALGVNYRDLERKGHRLPVVDVSVRYRAPAHYDDVLDIRCWVREASSRRVTFGYAIERDGLLLATAITSLIAVGAEQSIQRLPDSIRAQLVVVADPVRL
jgi:acyl-CoA thioester hydrolase